MNILVDHGSYLNLGDIAMLEGAVTRLHHALPEARLHVVYRDLPTKIYQASRVTRVPNYEIQSTDNRVSHVVLRGKTEAVTLRLALTALAMGRRADTLALTQGTSVKTVGEFCKPYDALHLVGGGMLNDVFPAQLLKKCALVLTFAAQNKPILLSGQQLGPFQNPFYKRVLGRALRRANFVGLREPTDSAALCQEFGLDTARFGLMGDDAFGVPRADDAQTLRILDACGVVPKKFIAVNLRIQRNYAPEFAQHAHLLGALAETLDERLQMPLLFVPIATDREQGDVLAAQRVAAEIPHVHAHILDRPDLSAGLVKGVLGHARGAVGASYHFCTFALEAGTPTVNVYDGRYYAQKARGLTAFWGDARLALALQNGNVQAAAENVLDVFQDDSLSRQLRTRARDAVANWETIFDTQARIIFGGKA